MNAEKEDLTDRPEKCTKQHAQTAAKNVKYHSNQAATGLFTAGSAGLREGGEKTLKSSRGE